MELEEPMNTSAGALWVVPGIQVFVEIALPENLAKEVCIHGYSHAVIREMQSRTAEAFAGFLLPYLKPDMTWLDCGCGPGSITLEFRPYLSAGRIVGIDLSPEQVVIAERAAASDADTSFQAADVYDLPFEDSSFGVIFSHTVLEHLSCPFELYERWREFWTVADLLRWKMATAEVRFRLSIRLL